MVIIYSCRVANFNADSSDLIAAVQAYIFFVVAEFADVKHDADMNGSNRSSSGH